MRYRILLSASILAQALTRSELSAQSKYFLGCAGLEACASFEIQTSPWTCGPFVGTPGSGCQTVGQGTQVSVNLRNLQSSLAPDVSNYFGISKFGFILGPGVTAGSPQGETPHYVFTQGPSGPVGAVPPSGGVWFDALSSSLIAVDQSTFRFLWGCNYSATTFLNQGGLQTCDLLGYLGFFNLVIRFDRVFTVNDIVGMTFGGVVADNALDLNRHDVSGVILTETVPEPSSLLLLGTGLAALGIAAWIRRRRRSVGGLST